MPDFAKSVERKEALDIGAIAPQIVHVCVKAKKVYPNARAFLFESPALTPFSNAVKTATNMQVFDAITQSNHIMSGFVDNQDGMRPIRSFYFHIDLLKTSPPPFFPCLFCVVTVCPNFVRTRFE